MTDITCPKCLAKMRAIDRSGIIIERCESCGGVFLDRNELDQLIRLETDYIERRFHTESDRRRDRRDDRNRDDDDNDWWDGDDDSRGVGGLLGELLRSIR